MAQKDSQLQRYTPEVQQATTDIVQQLPADINSLALQAKIAEAIVQRSEARILGAINEALAYRPSPSPAPAPTHSENNVRIDAININIDNSQNINYWQDNSQTYTDNSRHNYWADNSRRYTDNSDHSSRSYKDNSIDSGIIGAIAGFWPIALVLLVALALSSPCAQQIQQQQRQQQQEFQGGTAL